MFASRYFPDRFYAPRYWPKVGADAETPTNTNPTRRFSVSRQGATFTTDSTGATFSGKAGTTRFTADSDGSTFTSSGGNRFSGDE
jgi:hypothetical protein